MAQEPAVCRLWEMRESYRRSAVKDAQAEEWLIRTIRAASRQRPVDRETIGLANARLKEIRENPPEVVQ